MFKQKVTGKTVAVVTRDVKILESYACKTLCLCL